MKKNIALIFGGDSSEADVSKRSAQQMLLHLDTDLFDVYPISVQGTSWSFASGDATIEVNKNDFSLTIDGKHIKFDCAVPMIHGTPGEDGRIQAYLDLMKIPYTSSGLLTSALAFNKHSCKVFLDSLHISYPKDKLIRKGVKIDHERLCTSLGMPCFVKPNSGGSSFGITKVNTSEELKDAIELAFTQDANEVLIEEFIEGVEVTCGLVKLKDDIVVFPITEIVSKTDFFDVEAKYTVGMADEITPARISDCLKHECEALSTLIYQMLNCKGVVRIDYIVCNGRPYFLEINTIPGMSAESIVPKQIAATECMTIKSLYTDLIFQAID